MELFGIIAPIVVGIIVGIGWLVINRRTDAHYETYADMFCSIAQNIQATNEKLAEVEKRLSEIEPKVKEFNEALEEDNKKYNEGLENIFNYKVNTGIRINEEISNR